MSLNVKINNTNISNNDFSHPVFINFRFALSLSNPSHLLTRVYIPFYSYVLSL
jgi:hypothetical protein